MKTDTWDKKNEITSELLDFAFKNSPVNMFLLNEGGETVYTNVPSEKFSPKNETKKGRQPGAALACIKALQDGYECLHQKECTDCGIQNLVKKSFQTKQSQHKVQVFLDISNEGEKLRKYFLVDTSYKQINKKSFVLLSLEDISDEIEKNKVLEKNTRELLQSEERFRKIFREDKSIKLIVHAKSGNIVDANAAAEKFYSYDLETLKTMTMDHINTMTKEEIQEEMDKAVRNNSNYYKFKHRLANGKIRDVEVYATPVQFNRDNFLFVLVHDITEKENALQLITLSNQRFEAILDNFEAFVYAADYYTDEILYANQMVQEFYGKVLGKTCAEITGAITDKPCLFSSMDNLLDKNGKPTEGKVEEIHIEEFNIWARHHQKIIYWPDGRLARVSIAIDISANKESHKKLQELNSTKDRLLSVIGHDLKNPFSSILGFSELLLELLSDISTHESYKDLQQYANSIYVSSKKTYELLNNLLEWSRIQLGNIRFSPQKLSVISIVEAAIFQLTYAIKQKQIDLQKDVPESIALEADLIMISSVIQNLLSNAIKYSHNGGEIKILARVENNNLYFSIQDFGVGIDESDIRKLFSSEKHFSTKGTAHELGPGLGLLLCKDFLEIHNGKIFVQSKKDDGSTFSFRIPLSYPEE